MKTLFVDQIECHQKINDLFVISRQTPSTGKTPHKFHLGDRTGTIPAMCWSNHPDVTWEMISTALYAQVTGQVQSSRFSKGLEVQIESFLPVQEPDDLTPYLPTCPQDLGSLWQEVRTLGKTLQPGHLRSLLTLLFQDKTFRNAYRTAPGAQQMHHPYLGGLMEHSLEVALLCDAMTQVIPELDRDLLLVAALLHDIGKIEEIDYTSPHFSPTHAGGLLGHIFLGTRRVFTAMDQIEGFPPELRDALGHLLLSHQGKLEWGSPVSPALHEAQILHLCDHMSAQTFYWREASKLTSEKVSFQKVKGMEERVLIGQGGWKRNVREKTKPVPAPVSLVTPLEVVEGGQPLRLPAPDKPLLLLLPLLGSVAAGIPTEAQEEIEDYRPFPSEGNVREGDFVLRVRGDSMIDAHLIEGDLVQVRPQSTARSGEIVVALVDGESTIKFYIEENGVALLRPANPAYTDIYPETRLEIQGVVVSVTRNLF